MQRRRLLAGLVSGTLALVAGCAGPGGVDVEPPTRTTSTPTPYPNPGGLAVAERGPATGDPAAVDVRAVVANGAETERTGTLVASIRFDPQDGGEVISDRGRRVVTVPGRSTETVVVDLDLQVPSGTYTSVVDAFIEGNR